jgi:tRNA threonylcarbamoyladenosine biosynthesis protein TsaE
VKTRTRSAAQTRALGTAVAALLRPGDLVVLAGDLGSGKTTFAQGIAAGLGVDDPVVSPTFTIVREYEGRLPLAHVDVYRLDRLQELYDVGFEELVDGERVTIIEWGDVVQRVLPADHLSVELEPGVLPDERLVHVHAQGRSWLDRTERVESVVSSASSAEDG